MPSRHWYQGSWWVSLVSQRKGKKWKHCDLNFLDKHKTQFKDLLNIFGKIHFTLIVTHTKLILSRNVTFFFCCQLFCLQSCITAFCRISIYKSISDIELSFLSVSFLFFVQSLNKGKKISFGCFTNLGYDEVGKLSSS